MERYICIHCHFYQPPRENPWLEFIEVQDSAYPFHDWNERITAECYAPNAASRILNGDGRISRIVNNYARISFNFGPTLLSWMQANSSDVYQRILAADKESAERFSGHGSAIAQAYNHMILPLANRRDKYTQIFWGIRDFEARFGRQPEGMWLPETAVDLESLDIMAQLGIKFTILSPYQAARTRKVGGRLFKDVSGGKVDPTHPYTVKLSEGRSIAVFFYDGPISRAVAFERLLNSGEALAHRLAAGFTEDRDWPQLMHIATDGESYGHHHRHGDMALAFALEYIEEQDLGTLTNYGEYLEKFPPTYEAQIIENSSWSCAHGVERWNSHCGCNSGGGNGKWKQQWRTGLRAALDWLRDTCDLLFEHRAGELLHSPWNARDNYISVVLDRSPDRIGRFLAEHAKRTLDEDDTVTILKLMELQRHAMLMYTSCGWFFDEISGIETVQVIQYAARALQLARDIFDKDLEPGFLERLQNAKSNLPENKDGRVIYEKFVKPAMIGWKQAAIHYAISGMFHQYDKQTRIFSYSFEDEERTLIPAGKTSLAIGRVKVISEVTEESKVLCYAILYMGEHNLTGGVKNFGSVMDYDTLFKEIKGAFESADLPQTIRLIDRHFGEAPYSLKSLFKDEQRRILDVVLASTREDLENRFRLIAERYTPLINFLQSAGAPWPAALESARDFVLQSDIRRQIEAESIDLDRLRALVREAQTRDGRVLDPQLSYVVKNRMERLMQSLATKPEEVANIVALEKLAELVMPLPLGLNLWKVQNTYWELLQKTLPEFRQRSEAGEEAAQNWVRQFVTLGQRLGFALDEANVAAPVLATAA